MNVYDVIRQSGDFDEVEADFFERAGEDWVFIAGGREVFRVAMAEVEGITKSRNLRADRVEDGDQLFI